MRFKLGYPKRLLQQDGMCQAIGDMRKNPSQARAKTTVDTIFEATARIVEGAELGPLTTNHIAERAGYSVGTLYCYFPNKQSLLRSMALQEMRRQESRLMTALQSLQPDQGDAEIVRLVIRAALRPFASRNRLRLGLMRLLASDAAIADAARGAQDQVLDAMLNALLSRQAIPCLLAPHARFILLSSVSGTIQAAANERPDLFESQEFDDRLVSMVLDFVTRSTPFA